MRLGEQMLLLQLAAQTKDALCFTGFWSISFVSAPILLLHSSVFFCAFHSLGIHW